MRYEVKKLDPLSTAKFSALFYGMIALIPAGFTFLAMMFSRAGILSGIVAIIITPVVVAAAGFVVGLLFAYLYNWLSEEFGGLELEINIKRPKKKKK